MRPQGRPFPGFCGRCSISSAVVGIVVERRTAFRLVRASLPLLLLVVVAFCSTFWSETPLISAKEALGLVGTSLIALFFACRLSLVAFIESIGIALVIEAAISAVLIAFFPHLGRQAEMNGLWEGATVHKNILGIAMVQGLVTIACVIDRSHGTLRKLQIAAMVLFLVLLFGSGSVSSIVVAAMLFLTFVILQRSRAAGSAKPAIVALVVASAGAFGAFVSGFDVDQIFGALGKDPTLSGRTELWQFALDSINLRPILGYGYDVFFNPATPTGEAAIRGLDWDVNIYMAHNGFLEATLGLGLVGLALVILVLVMGFKRTAVMFWNGRDLATFWPLLTVIYTLFSNLTEAGIARVNDINWIIFMVAYLFATDTMQRRGVLPAARRRRRYA